MSGILSYGALAAQLDVRHQGLQTAFDEVRRIALGRRFLEPLAGRARKAAPPR
jgi:hypothetical protein